MLQTLPESLSLCFFTILLFVCLSNNIQNKNNILLYFIFLFVFAGDAVINLTKHKELCIIPFSLTHILLAIYYILDIKILKKDFLLLIPVLCFSALLVFWVSADIPNKLQLTVFIIYLGILDLMVWRALCYLRANSHRLKKWFIILGSAMFYFTDIVVCLNLIYPRKVFIVLMWLLYPPALVLLSLMNVQQMKSEN